uniref:Chromobox 3 n=1 Tax=Sipha flava TaxID=143950 RepID=A0A2S2R7F2_9HEMI
MVLMNQFSCSPLIMKPAAVETEIEGSGFRNGAIKKDYTVEKVLNKCTINGKLYYYLKWKNFSDKNNSWEPEENLQCKSLIKEYEAQSKREKKLKKKIQKSIINDRSKYRKKESTITKKTMPEEKVILINQKSSFTQNNSTLKRKIKPNAKVTINNKKITDGTIAGSTSLVKVNPSEDREKDSTLKKYTKPKEKVTLINQKSNFTQKNSTLKRKIKPNEKVTLNNKKITDATIAGSTSLVKVNPSEDREKDSTLKQKN